MTKNLDRMRVGGILTVMFLLAGPMAWRVSAAPLSWNNAGGGAAAAAANWSPVQVPAGADDLTFNLLNTYTVTWNATVNASNTHTYKRGVVTLSLSSPHTAAGGITVADAGTDVATMTVTTGTITSNANFVVGDVSGSSGTVNVNDDDADLIIGNGADLIVGNNGDASMSISGTGRVEVADQFIAGSNAASSPTITVSGFSIAPFGLSLLDVVGTGESRVGQGGDATMTISDGALARFAGDLVVANGSASNSTITIEDAGLLEAALEVDGDLLVGSNSSMTAAGTGTIVVNTGGQVRVGGATILGDPNGGTGTIDLGGGTIESASPIDILSGSLITGTGTIDADIANSGLIQPAGAAGLTINGILNNITINQITGTKFHFGPGGGYTGSGTCRVDITGDVASTITATGTLTIGDTTTSGFSYNGLLDVGGEDVTLLDSNGAVIGTTGVVAMDGGELTCANGIGISNGGRVEGQGTLSGVVTVSGVLDPQTAAVDSAIISIDGNLLMNPSGVFDMDVKGTPSSQDYDRANISGTATFGGTLRVRLPTGFLPNVGQQYIALNATGGRSAEFDAIIPPAPAPCNGVTFVMVYSSTAAIVLIRPPLGCTALGDLNSDGTHDGLDLQLFVDALAGGGPYDNCADLNGNCVNDAGDVPIMLNALLN